MTRRTGSGVGPTAPLVLLCCLLGPVGPGAAQEQTPQAGQEPEAPSCAKDPRYAQFDFWIGEWDVFNAQEALVGQNSIGKRIAGCMLFESWAGRGGSVGQSINFIDPATGRWKQIWVDGRGGLIDVEGGLKDGSMVLEGIHVLADGSSEPFRGSWTPLTDGRVRQHLEQSRDGGKTWYTWFDGYYVRKSD